MVFTSAIRDLDKGNDMDGSQTVRERTDVVTALREFLASVQLPDNGRLPNERDLAARLGITRAELRKGLAVLESEGQLWRRVGTGTFVGPKPPQMLDIAELAERTNALQMMRARIALEPELAHLAALNISAAEITELQALNSACRSAKNWREYEAYDARFHHGIAKAARNPVLLAMLDTLNGVRRAVTWGRPRPEGDRPSTAHHSFTDHDAIVDAISHGEPLKAAEAMRRHLQTVEDRLVGRVP
jgi:DNA-binding FadR family transcriptional regulator